jgi:O-antigen ligase
MAVQRRYRVSEPVPALRDVVARNPALPSALLATGAFVVFAASEGGFYPTTWYAGALFLLALLLVTATALGLPRGAPRPVLLALVLLAAYAAWSYLSIIWAGQEAEAWDGANRTALYLIVFALFTLWPFDALGARLVIGLLGAGIAIVGLDELLRADSAADPLEHLIGARLSEPTGYQNANAALFTLGSLCCLYMAAERSVPSLLRGPFLGGAGLLLALALLGQSRGWFIALPLGLVAMLLLAPGRLRLLAAVAACACGIAAIADPVLAVHDDFSPARVDGLLSDAANAILTMAGALTLLGLAGALVDRRVQPSPVVLRRARVAVASVVVLALAGGAVAFAVELGSPVTRVTDAWEDFKTGHAESTAGSSRLTSLGTNRYDFWTVAWEMFEDRPLIGAGSENFQQAYLSRGDSGEQPRYPHSLELGVLSQTGLIGAALLGGALLAGLAGALRARPAPAPERAAAMAATAVFLYWLFHASVDWFWEFPGLTAPAFAALGLACSLAPRAADEREPRTARPGPALAVGGIAGLLLAASFAAPWLSALETSKATNEWTEDAGTALERLERAADLNPLSARPALVAATIELRLGHDRAAERQFRRALERDPRSVYPFLGLGAIAAERGARARAKRLLRRAEALSPHDGVVGRTLEDLRAGRRVTTEAVSARLREQATTRLE